jgi:uncharacterized protein (DUF305 family)
VVACGSSGSSSTGAGVPGPAATKAGDQHNTADITFAQSMIPHHAQAIAMADLAATRASGAQVTSLAARIKAAQGPEITTLNGWLTAWGQPTVTPTAGMGTPDMGMGAGSGSMPSGMDMGSASSSSMGQMPGMMSDADMANLRAASGTAFDRMFLTMMIDHHTGAITMARTEQDAGRYPPAIQLAQRIATSQTTEITTMNALLATL